MPDNSALYNASGADHALDAVERADAVQCFGGDRRCRPITVGRVGSISLSCAVLGELSITMDVPSCAVALVVMHCRTVGFTRPVGWHPGLAGFSGVNAMKVSICGFIQRITLYCRTRRRVNRNNPRYQITCF